MVIWTEASSSSLPRVLWPVKEGQREGELAQCGVVDEGHEREGRAGALVIGDTAVERREVRGVLRRDQPAEKALALVRALLGLVGRREHVPVGLVVTSVRDAQEP